MKVDKPSLGREVSGARTAAASIEYELNIEDKGQNISDEQGT